MQIYVVGVSLEITRVDDHEQVSYIGHTIAPCCISVYNFFKMYHFPQDYDQSHSKQAPIQTFIIFPESKPPFLTEKMHLIKRIKIKIGLYLRIQMNPFGSSRLGGSTLPVRRGCMVQSDPDREQEQFKYGAYGEKAVALFVSKMFDLKKKTGKLSNKAKTDFLVTGLASLQAPKDAIDPTVLTSPNPCINLTAKSHPKPILAAIGTNKPNTELTSIPMPKKQMFPQVLPKIPAGICVMT